MDVDFAGGRSRAWYAITDTLPIILVFIAILIVGWVVAKVLSKLAEAVLERVGFDRAVERGGVKRTLGNSKYASDLVAKIVFYAILLITLTTAFSVFGPNPLSDLLQGIIAWLPQLLVAIVIIVVASAIATGVRDLIAGSLSGLSYGRWLARLAWVFILALGIIAALNQVGIATTVTTPVLIAVLATIAGTPIVGVGGGLIQPMRAAGTTGSAAPSRRPRPSPTRRTGSTTVPSRSITSPLLVHGRHRRSGRLPGWMGPSAEPGRSSAEPWDDSEGAEEHLATRRDGGRLGPSRFHHRIHRTQAALGGRSSRR